SDGKKLKHKLVLASNTMNLLFTCSVILSEKDNVQIGPSVSVPTAAIDSQATRVFYRKWAVEQF
ncbi:uncharacterized protein BYT42DRAFT_477543, partial [Radiomyces spectabilis]|uniref:uncharacterized protein n=1 Tax=Radiomyces spectabilis TaxID=64574 RepID=UPI0022208444